MKNTNLDKKVVVDREKCVRCGRCADIQIPENHYISCLVGFRWPEYQFVRGVQRSDGLKINRITGETTKELL